MTELGTKYNFRDVETKWCDHWEKYQTFHAEPQADRDSYSIVIPPPNVTGILHMGHALNNTLQDIMIRYKRMQGFQTCWMPGTDHAGIATQNVVERDLAKNGQTRDDIGREEMLKRLWEWKEQYGDTIINQLKKLGASCDWPRTRFTMDEGYSQAVGQVFVHLYEKGLVYRGEYIINWCPRCQTALSDEEAEHREQQGALYHIRYPLKDNPDEFITVATTRPETMLGDTAVAVHPNDERYKSLIGKTLILPLIEREIPVIADEFVDPQFGTGAVKVTPAHDPNDFAIGKRHQLPFINIMNPDGILNQAAGDFSGSDRFEAREAVIECLQERKLLIKTEQHTHSVGHCYRCHTVVEPYLSRQWFVKMEPLAEPALKAVQDGKIRFIPERWTKVYTNWMENIRDWCISRQIWWGHRIPAWYCCNCNPQLKPFLDPKGKKLEKSEPIPKAHLDIDNSNVVFKDIEPVVSLNKPTCPKCASNLMVQDPDVLDTWFSSWLWPFATFGWPQQSEDLKYFYPTQSLFTASEIIFFWVARMVMAGLEFMGDIPFSEVYIHGTVRDAQGRKMSKSLGNAIDPLEIIREYGGDALRFSLIINSGQDLYISKEKFEIGRNFANKIWNACRLVLMKTDQNLTSALGSDDQSFDGVDLPSRWILSKLHTTNKELSRAIEEYRFSEAENLIYEFFWRTFCDWYLEIIKNRLDDPDVQRVALTVIHHVLRMIHPFMPFVTEEIWQHVDPKTDQRGISRQPWPVFRPELVNPQSEADMALITEIVTGLRNLKAQWNIKPQQKIDCLIGASDHQQLTLLKDNTDIITTLIPINNLTLEKSLPAIKEAAAGMAGAVKFLLPLAGIIDIEQEKHRMNGEINQIRQTSANIAKRLSNKNFTDKAPAVVVEKEKERLTLMQTKIAELEKVIQSFQ